MANPGSDAATWTAENPAADAEISAIVRQPGHRRRLDYVLVGSWHAHPGARAEIRGADIVFDHAVDGVWLSDHYGLLVELDVTRDPRAP